VDRDIAWAKKYGIYIILDMHQWRWSPHFGGNGLPVWMVASYPNSKEGMGQAIMDFWLGKGPNGTDANETNPSMQERFVNVWKYVAQRYVNEPTIAAYELFNEPYHSSDLIQGGLDPAQTASYLFPFYCKVIESIRIVDANHIIAYQPVGGWDSGRAQKLNYSNLVYTFHFYGESPYSGNSTKLKEDFMYRYNPPYTWQSKPIEWNMPIWLGEFGTDAQPWNPNASLYVRDMMVILNEIQIGWAWWVYWKSDTYGKALLYANGTERTELTTYLKLT
jgi:aryl-phospho-beta-D-glucosidase BglC (GH1 family)